MRILLITHFFPPERNAGTENYTLGLAQVLQARGHDVHVVCATLWETGPAYWNSVTEDTETGVHVHRIHVKWTRANDPNLVVYSSHPVEEWLNQFLEAMKPDIVHVTSTMTLGVGTLRSTWNTGIPLVLTLMDFWFLCPRTTLLRSDGKLCNGITTPWECQQCLLASSRLYRRVQFVMPERIQPIFWNKASKLPALARRRGLRGLALNMEHRKALMRSVVELPNVILAHSKFVKRTFSQGGLSKRVLHLPNGHDLSWLPLYHGKTKSPFLRLGYIGQIIDIKGVDVLVKAFKNAKLDGRAYLDIWGDLSKDERYVQELHALIGDTESIRLRGRFERTQIPEVLADLDVLVVPSLWYENAPLVIYEAFATKTPVIATDLGGMAEAVTHEVNGLLFERGNIDDLVEQLHRIIQEPDLVIKLRAGIGPVKTIQEEVSELESIYQELTQQELATDLLYG
jgi:glycosyltransferase involved in cell wall biosynthesis